MLLLSRIRGHGCLRPPPPPPHLDVLAAETDCRLDHEGVPLKRAHVTCIGHKGRSSA